MDRMNTRRSVGDAERADPADETVINGAPYDPSNAIAGAAVVRGTADWNEYLRDHGPDLDDRLDGTESDQEL